MTRARALAIGRRAWPVARVLWRERKAEVGIALATASIVRQIVQALGH